MRQRLRLAVQVAFGRNPWPVAGPAGHIAMALNSLLTLIYGLVVVVSLSSGWVNNGMFGWDFTSYFAGATLVVQGEAHRLYDLERHWEVQHATVEAVGGRPPYHLPYVNPPLLATVVALLVPLGLLGAITVWRLINLAIALLLLLAIVKQDDPPAGWRRSTALLLCFFPFVEIWHHAQMSGIMLLAFGGWFGLVRANHPWLAGMALSLSLLKPQHAPPMLLYLAWKRQWSQLGGFAAGGAAQALFTGLLFLREGQIPSIEALRDTARFSGGTQSFVEQQLNLRGAIWNLLPGLDTGAQMALLLVLTLLVTGAFLLLVGTRWESPSPSPSPPGEREG